MWLFFLYSSTERIIPIITLEKTTAYEIIYLKKNHLERDIGKIEIRISHINIIALKIKLNTTTC